MSNFEVILYFKTYKLLNIIAKRHSLQGNLAHIADTYSLETVLALFPLNIMF